MLIVAPFIKVDPLSRLLECVAEGVRKTIVTRWRLPDVLSGVSDLEVFNLAMSRNAELRLYQDLHAKLYAADDSCLIGSANVTGVALGWRSPPNVELLVSIPRSDSRIGAFERRVLDETTLATREQYDLLRELASRVGKAPDNVNFEDGDLKMAILPASWVPEIRNPEELYAAYVGDEDASFGLFRSVKSELSEMRIADGLSKAAFYTWVGEAISQTPLIRGVTKVVDRDGQVTEAALSKVLLDNDLTERAIDVRDLLEVLGRWLTEFLPARYETARDSIKLIRARRV